MDLFKHGSKVNGQLMGKMMNKHQLWLWAYPDKPIMSQSWLKDRNPLAQTWCQSAFAALVSKNSARFRYQTVAVLGIRPASTSRSAFCSRSACHCCNLRSQLHLLEILVLDSTQGARTRFCSNRRPAEKKAFLSPGVCTRVQSGRW